MKKIGVLIHPQSIIHGIIEFFDGSFMVHLSPTDMKFAIQYALFYPERANFKWERLSFDNLKLEFYPVDEDKFPNIFMIFVSKGDIYPAILVISDEFRVSFFEGIYKILSNSTINN